MTSWLSLVVSAVSLSLSHWYPVSGVVLDCIDSGSLHPYLLLQLARWRSDTAPENFGIYSFIEHDRFDFFTSEERIRAVMYMPCVNCSGSELKLAKHLHTFFVLT